MIRSCFITSFLIPCFMELNTIKLCFNNKKPFVYTICFFFSVSVLFTTANIRVFSSGNIGPLFAKTGFRFCFQELKKSYKNPSDQKIIGYEIDNTISESAMNPTYTRRLLAGPGSFPPRCLSKCDRCTPCKPVHITVPPGIPVAAQYYPEAWRCKCHNKLYMP